MNKDSINFTKEEIFRMYEQSEMSEIINEGKPVHKRIKKLKAYKNKFPFLYTLVSAGTVAGAISLLTLLRRYKLF